MDNLLEELKKNVSVIIHTINEDNLEEVKEEVSRYFQLAEVMIDLIGGKKKPLAKATQPVFEIKQKPIVAVELQKQKTIVEQEVITEIKQEVKQEIEEVEEEVEVRFEQQVIEEVVAHTREAEAEKKERDASVLKDLAGSFEETKLALGYPLSRNLYGGFLLTGSSTNSIYVPESIIRELELNDGDVISAEVIPGGSHLKPFYKYNRLRKGSPLKTAVRQEFQFGIVAYDEELKRFYVEQDINKNNLRVNESPNRFMISEEDARSYNLKVDDVVDVSWYENNFTKGRTIWKYNVSELPTKETSVSKKMLAYKQSETKLAKEKEVALEDFTGKRICLVGVEPYHSDFKEIVESRGGRLVALTSLTKKVTMNASIRKADLVVVGISHTSHDASQYANERAKKYEVPFKAFSGFGKTTFLKAINEGLAIH